MQMFGSEMVLQVIQVIPYFVGESQAPPLAPPAALPTTSSAWGEAAEGRSLSFHENT